MALAFHLPTACYACDRSWLAPPGLGCAVTCPSCGGPADVVPGESYQVDDVALFARLEGVVRDSQLPRLASHRLWTILNNVVERTRRPDLLLLPVVKAMPALKFVQTNSADDRAHLARAAGMILVVITAHQRALDARDEQGTLHSTTA
jgi:hypothetical protein